MFARAWQHLPRYEWRGVPFRAWLLRIAYTQVLGRARRRSSHELVLVELPAASSEGADAQALRDLDAGELLAALARLGDAHQAVLELRFLRECSVAETAGALELTEEAVRSLTYRALRALRAAMVAAVPAEER